MEFDHHEVLYGLVLPVLLLCCAGAEGVARREVCADSIQNCASYGHAACTQYQAWAQHNCPLFCQFCISAGGSTSGQASSSCADVIPNCAALGPTLCRDYVEFAHINCQKTCNLCGTSAIDQCQNKLSNCEAYGQQACRSPYEAWARENCAKLCNFCHSAVNDTLTGYSSGCFYNGHGYQEGQTWKDGCEKNCTCIDQRTGNYLCQALCPTYQNLPDGCHMVTPPGECCAKPQCPQRQGCQYKGQVYTEGQQWKDGCDYLCSCKDGSTGFYQCQALCISWTLLPQCHLELPAPGKCCRTPNCPPEIVIQYPENYVAN